MEAEFVQVRNARLELFKCYRCGTRQPRSGVVLKDGVCLCRSCNAFCEALVEKQLDALARARTFRR